MWYILISHIRSSTSSLTNEYESNEIKNGLACLLVPYLYPLLPVLSDKHIF